MRPITGTDIIDFYYGHNDILVLTAAGEFDHIDGQGSAYEFIATDDGDEVQVLLERSAIADGDWFPDALTDGGDLILSVAQEMADIINQDGILPSRAAKAIHAGENWQKADEVAKRLAACRAAAVAEVVAYCGGNQSKAGRVLGLDQSTVNKLVAKHRRAAEAASEAEKTSTVRYASKQDAIEALIIAPLGEYADQHDIDAIADATLAYNIDTDAAGNELLNTAGFEQTVTDEEFWAVVQSHNTSA